METVLGTQVCLPELTRDGFHVAWGRNAQAQSGERLDEYVGKRREELQLTVRIKYGTWWPVKVNVGVAGLDKTWTHSVT